MLERVRGVLINDGMIVLIKRIKKNENYYVFPGGGVESGEDLIGALKREMREELGVNVSVEQLLIQKRFDRPGIDQMEYFYLCEIVGGVLGTGNGPEYQPANNYEGAHEVIKMPISGIQNLNLLPSDVKVLVLKNYWFRKDGS